VVRLQHISAFLLYSTIYIYTESLLYFMKRGSACGAAPTYISAFLLYFYSTFTLLYSTLLYWPAETKIAVKKSAKKNKMRPIFFLLYWPAETKMPT
jgi:hypothetical protein